MNNSTSVKNPFPIASFFLIAYSIMLITHNCFNMVRDNLNEGYLDLSYYIPEVFLLILPLIAGIFLLIFKKPAIVTSFLLISFTAIKGYNVLSLIGYSDILSELAFFTEFMIFAALLLTSIFFISASLAGSEKKGILKIWFLPAIISISATCIYYIADPIISLIEYDMTFDSYIYNYWEMYLYAFYEIILALALFFLGLWLYKYNCYQALKTAEPVSYNSYSSAYTQSTAQQTVYTQNQQPAYSDKSQQIARYQTLLNEGAITPEEYESVRRQIYGI